LVKIAIQINAHKSSHSSELRSQQISRDEKDKAQAHGEEPITFLCPQHMNMLKLKCKTASCESSGLSRSVHPACRAPSITTPRAHMWLVLALVGSIASDLYVQIQLWLNFLK
jgi:hypothetical protein